MEYDYRYKLCHAINKLYRKDLSDESKQELNVINTHESTLKPSENLLKELAKLNMIALERKYSKRTANTHWMRWQ